MVAEQRDIQRHVLSNGLVVVTETMRHVRSVSVGVWIRNGSRREALEQNGLAHFMEHMVFKGTERRSAESIAREMDSVGGMLDAFTSKEQICFNAKVPRAASGRNILSVARFSAPLTLFVNSRAKRCRPASASGSLPTICWLPPPETCRTKKFWNSCSANSAT